MSDWHEGPPRRTGPWFMHAEVQMLVALFSMMGFLVGLLVGLFI